MPTTNQVAPTAHSHSRMMAYSGCPLAYRLEYIDRVGTDSSDAMEIGAAAHDFFEAWVKNYSEMVEGEKAIATIAAMCFQKQPRDQSNFKEYLEICKIFASNYKPDPEYPDVETERQVAFDRNWQVCDWFSKNVMFRVKIDLLELPGSIAKKIRVTDYKTGYAGAVDSFQLDVYALACCLIFPHLEQVEICFYYVKSGFKQKKLLDVKDLDVTKIQLESLMLKMEHDTRWKARPGARCQNCPVAHACDQKPTDLVTISKIEHAQTLGAEIAFLEAQAKAKKKALKNWCEKQGPVTTNGLIYSNWPQESLKIEMAPLLSLCVQFHVDPAEILNTDSTAIKKVFKSDPAFAEAISPFVTVETKTAFRSKKADGDE